MTSTADLTDEQGTDTPPSADVTVDADRLEESASTDDVPDSLEVQLRRLLPDHAYWSTGLRKGSAGSVMGAFLSKMSGGQIQLDDDEDDEGCDAEEMVVSWSSPAGVWCVTALRCSGKHRDDGYDLTIAAGSRPSEIQSGNLPGEDALALVRILCRDGLKSV